MKLIALVVLIVSMFVLTGCTPEEIDECANYANRNDCITLSGGGGSGSGTDQPIPPNDNN